MNSTYKNTKRSSNYKPDPYIWYAKCKVLKSLHNEIEHQEIETTLQVI